MLLSMPMLFVCTADGDKCIFLQARYFWYLLCWSILILFHEQSWHIFLTTFLPIFWQPWVANMLFLEITSLWIFFIYLREWDQHQLTAHEKELQEWQLLNGTQRPRKPTNIAHSIQNTNPGNHLHTKNMLHCIWDNSYDLGTSCQHKIKRHIRSRQGPHNSRRMPKC